MNTDSTHAPGVNDDQQAKESSRNSGWFAVFLVFPLIAVLNAAASPLISAILTSDLPVTLDFTDAAAARIGDVDTAVDGLATLDIPLADLSTWAITQFIVAKGVWIVGLFIATWFASRAVTEVVEGTPFSTKASRGLAGLSWTLVITGPAYAIAQIPADNLIVRDLGLGDSVSSGLTADLTYLWVGAVLASELLRRAVRRGRAVQSELEGVI